jgi:hypothetical protein
MGLAVFNLMDSQWKNAADHVAREKDETISHKQRDLVDKSIRGEWDVEQWAMQSFQLGKEREDAMRNHLKDVEKAYDRTRLVIHCVTILLIALASMIAYGQLRHAKKPSGPNAANAQSMPLPIGAPIQGMR